MKADALLSLALTLVELGVGVAIFRRNPRGVPHMVFFAFVLSLSLWGFSDFALRLTSDRGSALLFYKVGAIGFCLFPALYAHFMAVFTNSPSLTWRPSFYLMLYGCGLAITMFVFQGYLVELSPSEGAYSVGHSIGYELYIVWLVLCCLSAFAFLFKRIRTRSLPPPARQAMRYLLAGFLLFVTTGVILDAMTSLYGFRPILSAGVSSLVVVVFSGFALIRYRGMVPTSEAVSAKVLDSMTDLVCLVDLQGSVTFYSKGFRNALHLALNEAPMHVRDFVVEADQLLLLLREGQTLEQPMTLEIHYRTRTGLVFPVSLSLVRFPLEDAPPGMVLIGRDITERHELTRKAAESEEKYRNIVESSLDGIVIIQDEKLVFVNPSAVDTFGYSSAKEMMKANFGDTVAPGSKPFLIRTYDSNKIGDDIFKNYEMKGLTQSGMIIDLEINAKLVSWNGRPAVQASFRDITERKSLEKEQALWFWEQESLSAIDRQLVSMVDLESVLNAVTRHARTFCRADFSGVMMVNVDDQEYRWKGVRGNLHPAGSDPLPFLEPHRKLLERNTPVMIKNLGAHPDFPLNNFPILAREGVASLAAFPFRLEHALDGVLVVGFRKDRAVGEREMRLLSSLAEKAVIAVSNARLYESLREHEQELEHLSQARVLAQEEERRRIAREIHDGLGQMLTAIKFSVEVMEDSPGLEERERKKLAEIKELLDNVMTEAREISYNLMPSVLEDFGLVPALQLLCDNFSKRLNTKAAFVSHGNNGRYERALEINLYRIAQEALNNTAKYADAGTVELQLLRSDSGVRMTIVDDGKGFNRGMEGARHKVKEGVGLVSMRERATAFGGLLTIESSPGKGTSITVEIPITKTETHGSH